MQVSKLEELSARLHGLRMQLHAQAFDRDVTLDDNHELVQAANECEFMLPEHLTVNSLAQTVDHKIEIVSVLIERARNHEALPESAQLAAEQEYSATDEDYLASLQEQDLQQQASMPR